MQASTPLFPLADATWHHVPAPRVVALYGSPSARSRSAALLRAALDLLPEGASHGHIDIGRLPAQALLHADLTEPALADAVELLRQADWLFVATPIYKAAYSGALKLFLDLLPPDALRGKRVLPLATGGSPAHLLAIDYALKPVLAALGARDILDAVYATDAQFLADAQGGWRPDEAAADRLRRAIGVPLPPQGTTLGSAAKPFAAPPRPPTGIDRSGAATAAC